MFSEYHNKLYHSNEREVESHVLEDGEKCDSDPELQEDSSDYTYSTSDDDTDDDTSYTSMSSLTIPAIAIDVNRTVSFFVDKVNCCFQVMEFDEETVI